LSRSGRLRIDVSVRLCIIATVGTVMACHGGRLTGFEAERVPDAGAALTCPAPAPCREVALDPSAGACVISISPDGAPCEDACLTGASCHAGRCEGSALSCDDANACTIDLCGAGTGCAHTPRVCPAPSDPCLAASCDPLTGCLETPVADGTSCGPSDCVTAHVCIEGACVERALPPSAACEVTSLSAGYGHSCATFQGGTTRCWGGNSVGQLGDGTTDNRSVATLIGGVALTAVSTGDAHSCGVATDGTVFCWGDNYTGALGDGTKTGHLSPVAAIGFSGPARRVSCGRSTTCVVLASTGGVQCAGDWAYGQRGAGLIAAGAMPNDVMGMTSGVEDIAAGWDFTCALQTSGTVACWGADNNGGLGDGKFGPVDAYPTPIPLDGGAVALTAGGTHACALLTDGRVQCWGSNADGQLGNGGPEQTLPPVDVVGLPAPVTAISAGYWHTCAIAASEAWCWGSGYVGQLGDARKQTSTTPVQVLLPSTVRAIAAGGFHSCAALTDGTLACWGSNELGQVGNGTNDEQDAPATVVVP
jgi:alpha-tubulin suppressor-like RCC1 family protein